MNHLVSNIKGIYIDNVVKDTYISKSVIKNCKTNKIFFGDFSYLQDKDFKKGYVYILKHKGKFFKSCPGTKFYNCCGYKILHIGEGCPLNCSYCILKAYFSHKSIKVWGNIDDLFEELEKVFANKNKRFRVGTGEFTDSLALESLTNYSKYLITFLNNYENVVLELKSKIVDLSWMDAVEDPRRILPAWSLNAIDLSLKEELSTTYMEDRLKAARKCVDMGFRVCLHFDPIIYYKGWEKGYSQIIDLIFDYLQPENIAYMSLGSFRGMPYLFEYIEKMWPETDYIFMGEYVQGVDGKMRLFRPLRVKQFKFIIERLKKYGLSKQLYFCMESDEVWKACFGYTPDKLGGLAKHLLRCAFESSL